MRKTAEDLNAKAVILLVPKSKIAFPQVWKREGWPAGDLGKEGVIVQLESNGGGNQVRRVWFFPFPLGNTTDDGRTLGNPMALDHSNFSLLPTLLKEEK